MISICKFVNFQSTDFSNPQILNTEKLLAIGLNETKSLYRFAFVTPFQNLTVPFRRWNDVFSSR